MNYIDKYLEIKKYVDDLKSVCSVETCYPLNRSQWTKDNPLCGHCALIVAGIYYKYGGKIIRGIIKDSGISHYWNRVDNINYDMTYEQFGLSGAEIINAEISNIDRIMSNEDTMNRFQILMNKYNELNSSNENTSEKEIII